MSDDMFPLGGPELDLNPEPPPADEASDSLVDLAFDFWFEPALTFDDAFWPIGLAVTWIAWRDQSIAGTRFAELQQHGRKIWLAPEGAGRIMHPREAERQLLDALRAGTVSAYGLPPEGRREPIGKHEWVDLRLFGLRADDRLENAVSQRDAAVLFSDVRLLGTEVTALWPAGEPAPVSAPRKPPGPSPVQRRRVFDEMSKFAPDVLATMGGEEMKERFGVSTTYCNSVRKQVLFGQTNTNR